MKKKQPSKKLKKQKKDIRKNKILLSELNKIRRYFTLLEIDTLNDFINHKEAIQLIIKKLIFIDDKVLTDSINKFFLTLNKVESSLCAREEFIFELLKDKQTCMKQINLLINKIS